MPLKKNALRGILFSLYLFIANTVLSQDSTVMPLWTAGAPGFENRKTEPEQAGDWWVRNINNPSLTVFTPPRTKANKTAVIICPGGGFKNLVFNAEGIEAAKYLNSLGITAFVLKYRLFRMEGSPYKKENAWQDIFRAMRLVKSLSDQYQIDSNRIGVMGFSAGGELAGWLSYHGSEKHFAGKADATDMHNAQPGFQVLIYPGPLVVPSKIESNAPPTFMLASNDDACCSQPLVQLVQMHRLANVPVEMHLYAKGNHAFNMGYKSEFASLKNWPQRLTEWLSDNGWLK